MLGIPGRVTRSLRSRRVGDCREDVPRLSWYHKKGILRANSGRVLKLRVRLELGEGSRTVGGAVLCHPRRS